MALNPRITDNLGIPDKESTMRSKGRVIDFYRTTTQRCENGIKGGRGYSRNSFGYYNGYGSFCEYPEYHLIMKVAIYNSNYRSTAIDIRDEVLEASNRQRISQNLINSLIENNCGKKIWLEGDDEDGWEIEDLDELDLDC
jgi:hypothetical protein